MNNILKIIIPGQPKGKASSRKGKFGNWYNPSSKDMDYMTQMIKDQIPKEFLTIEKDHPIKMDCFLFFMPNQSQIKNKKFMEKIKNEDFPYLKKPDRDNCIKSIQDSCTDAKLWKDDNQVYAGALEKYYSIKPRIELTLIY